MKNVRIVSRDCPHLVYWSSLARTHQHYPLHKAPSNQIRRPCHRNSLALSINLGQIPEADSIWQVAMETLREYNASIQICIEMEELRVDIVKLKDHVEILNILLEATRANIAWLMELSRPT